ncbi:MAG: DeoR family transcriptional regulator [Chloroflexota bacterium]|nr:DeoR family transcriptional regulator [Chloroflexota bacterium]
MPSARQAQIVKWLSESADGALSIDALAQRLGVSAMTIHRDLNQLAQAGQVEKVHGGVIRAHTAVPSPFVNRAPTCALCAMPVFQRTDMLIQPGAGADPLYACCPHCGLMLVEDQPALARDFLFGRMVNARQATYLLAGDVSLCCIPSVLCFATQDDGRRFQQGFNGWLATFDEARAHLMTTHGAQHESTSSHR